MPRYKVKVNAVVDGEPIEHEEVVFSATQRLSPEVRMSVAVEQVKATHPEMGNPVAVSSWNVPDPAQLELVPA